MAFKIARTHSVRLLMESLAKTDERKFKKVRKTLGLLSIDPKYPGLNSHKIELEKGPKGEDIWESYIPVCHYIGVSESCFKTV